MNQPADRLNFDFNIEHVLTKTHTLRFQFDRDTNSSENLGVGTYDLESRAYSREGFTNMVRVSDVGSFKKKYLNEIRVQYSWQESESFSGSDATTVRVQDAFTDGGAQISGGRKYWQMTAADNLDIPLGKKHSLRTGFEIETGNYIGDECGTPTARSRSRRCSPTKRGGPTTTRFARATRTSNTTTPRPACSSRTTTASRRTCCCRSAAATSRRRSSTTR